MGTDYTETPLLRALPKEEGKITKSTKQNTKGTKIDS
jgi:hypothetical protein